MPPKRNRVVIKDELWVMWKWSSKMKVANCKDSNRKERTYAAPRKPEKRSWSGDHWRAPKQLTSFLELKNQGAEFCH